MRSRSKPANTIAAGHKAPPYNTFLRVGPALPAVFLLVLAFGCTSPAPATCPGARVADLELTVTPIPDGGTAGGTPCGFTPPGRKVRAVLAWDPAQGGTATLCLDRPQAARLQGTHSGDHISLSSGAGLVPLQECAGCTVKLEEVLSADLVRDDGGAAVGLANGQVVDSLASGNDSCAGAGASCPLPCSIGFTVTGVP